MELVSKRKLHLYTGRSNPVLAADIAEHLGVSVGPCELVDFANGEIRARFGESVARVGRFHLADPLPN